jgi:hypothetical protein
MIDQLKTFVFYHSVKGAFHFFRRQFQSFVPNCSKSLYFHFFYFFPRLKQALQHRPATELRSFKERKQEIKTNLSYFGLWRSA